MKKSLLIFLSLNLGCAYVQAQKNENPAAPTKSSIRIYDLEEGIYAKAMKYGDYEVAKYAIYTLIQKHPDDKSYLDSLTRIYFSLGAYGQCILTGRDFLQDEDTANTTIMELVAISEGSLNRHKESLELWDKLWRKSGNLQYAYQIAVNQYLLQRYGECGQTIDIIIKDPAADKETVTITSDKNKSQKVAMKAAAHNLLGVIQKDLSMTEKAKENFEAAIKISPDFELAKNNLELLNKSVTPKEEAKPKTPAKKK